MFIHPYYVNHEVEHRLRELERRHRHRVHLHRRPREPDWRWLLRGIVRRSRHPRRRVVDLSPASRP